MLPDREGQAAPAAAGPKSTTRPRRGDELTRAAGALKESEDALSLALEAGRAGTFTWDLRTGLVRWSPHLERLYGVPPGSFEGTLADWEKRVLPEDVKRVLAGVRETLAQKREEYNYEFRAILPNGEVRWFRGQSRFHYDEGQEPAGMLGINVDIHERKVAAEAMVRNEKLVAGGRLLATIAHEINNPLESVTNLIYLAQISSDAAEVADYLTTAQSQLKRIAAITSQTLRFQKQTGEGEFCDLSEMISGTLVILRGRLTSANVTLRIREDWTAKLPCNEGEVRQVLLNLFSNAVDAMAGGGVLTIRTRKGKHRKTGLEGVSITVSDTGSGMSAATRQKLFRAFFSTKGAQGNGLGLWISHGIVEKHQGYLRLRSTDAGRYRGTTFQLFLPGSR